MANALCNSCGSCGFPMRTPEDYAGGNVDAKYCSTCAEASGNLKAFDVLVQANAEYFVRHQGIDPKAGRELARTLLLSMPAWKNAPKS